MPFHYTKICDLTFNNSTMYFRTPCTKDMPIATIFSDKYMYYHSLFPNVNTCRSASDMTYLGKFVKMDRRGSCSIYADYDYSVYEFESGSVNCKQDGRIDGEIYMVAIPDSDDGMETIENMLYRGWPVFFKLL